MRSGWGRLVSAFECEGSPRIGAVYNAEDWRIGVDCDRRRVNGMVVGLGDVEVLGVDGAVGLLRVHVRRRAARLSCGTCGQSLWSDGGRRVVLVDLPVFGRATRLVWHKRRWRCPAVDCAVGTVTAQDREIASRFEGLTARAGRWVTFQAGRGRPLRDLAGELGCCGRVVSSSVQRWGQVLCEADTQRLDGVEALGPGETLMARRGRFKTLGLVNQRRRRRPGRFVGHSAC